MDRENGNSRIESLEKAHEVLNVKENIQSNMEIAESVDEEALEFLKENLKKSEIRLSAFLNKEFNILNKKMINCCIFCYNDHKVFLIIFQKN